MTVKTVEEAAARSDAVFMGWVVALELDESSWNLKTVRFRVTTSWKGTAGEYVTVRTGMGGGDCGVDYELGSSYFVFAGLDDDELVTTTCSGPTEKYSVEDLNVGLGEPKEQFDWLRKR